jgi:hypothetical protein
VRRELLPDACVITGSVHTKIVGSAGLNMNEATFELSLRRLVDAIVRDDVGQERPYGTHATRSNGEVQWIGPVHILRVGIGAGFNETDDRRCLRHRIPHGRTGNPRGCSMKRFGTPPVLRPDALHFASASDRQEMANKLIKAGTNTVSFSLRC